jgi:AcrR family transcriptional regulator
MFATLDRTKWNGGIVPISDCEVRDPRIRRTRQLLQGALRGLLGTKSFDEISVQDITEAATVNRATFYDHYADKFALLDALVAGGFHALLHERQVRFDGSCAGAAGAVIQATCDYLVMMQPDGGECKGHSSFEPLIDAAIVRAIHMVFTRENLVRGVESSLPAAMAATAVSWGIFGAAKEWFAAPQRPPVGQVVPEILALLLPVLERGLVARSELAAAGAGD